MPGVNLNLDLPDVTNTLAVMVAKTKTCLSAIQDDLTPQVVASELNLNAALPFNGNAATGLGSVGLVSGNVPTAAGSIYYNGGEFYAIDATSTVKLTNLGTIAVAGVKGIGGDYGSVSNSALVSYNNTSAEYSFFDGTGAAYGNIVCKYVAYEAGTAHAVRLKAPTSIVATFDLTLPTALPTAAGQVVSWTTGGVASFAGVPGWKVANPITVAVPGSAALPTSGGTLPTYGAPGAWSFPAVSTAHVEFPVVLPVGSVITAYNVYWNKSTNATNTIFVNFFKVNATGGSAAFTGSTQQSSAAASPGAVVLGQTGLSYTTVAGEAYTMICQTSGVVAGDLVASCAVTYYIP